MNQLLEKLLEYRDTNLGQYAIQASAYIGVYQAGDSSLDNLSVSINQIIGVSHHNPSWEEIDEKAKFDELLRQILVELETQHA